jgi:hypothetical protein
MMSVLELTTSNGSRDDDMVGSGREIIPRGRPKSARTTQDDLPLSV